MKVEDYSLIRADSVPNASIKMQAIGGAESGRLVTQQVWGASASLMYATRGPGYHSVPHAHACEQINLCLEGSIWVFIDDEGWELRAGDYMRVPPDMVHWAWNRGDADAVIVEVHSPGLDLLADDDCVVLLPQGAGRSGVPNRFLPDFDYATVERRILGESG